MRNLLFAFAWFPLTLALILANLKLLHALSSTATPPAQAREIDQKRLTAAAGTAQILGASVVAGDARALLLESFLRQHNSPMEPYADLIVAQADANGLDFRLIVAIAMCESNLGKRMPKKDTFNAWGIAVYTGTNDGKTFESWPQAIEWVSRYLKTRYYDRGITDLRDIGAIWAPPSVERDYSWTNCVQGFQQSIL